MARANSYRNAGMECGTFRCILPATALCGRRLEETLLVERSFLIASPVQALIDDKAVRAMHNVARCL